MAAKPKFKLETEYINTLVGDGAYGLTVTRTASAEMKSLGVVLADVNHVLTTGNVVRSDMLEMRGLWDVHGSTVNDMDLELTVAVIANEYDVELLEVLLLKRKGNGDDETA